MIAVQYLSNSQMSHFTDICLHPRVHRHQKKRPGVDFFAIAKASSAGLTLTQSGNASKYSNITSSALALPGTSSPRCFTGHAHPILWLS